MNAAVRIAALAGAAVTAALSAWLLGGARVTLSEGGSAAMALADGAAALVWTQVLTLLLIGYPAVAGLALSQRLLALTVLAAAPLPLAGILLAMGAAAPAALVGGQLVVAACGTLVALAGRGAERLLQSATRWHIPALQITSLAVLLLVQHNLPGAG